VYRIMMGPFIKALDSAGRAAESQFGRQRIFM
jgi:hypothetical protein